MSLRPFHLAFPVTDLPATRAFFVDLLGCSVGRESERWIDFDFFGHQITAHLVERMPEVATNPVDGKQVPSSHFGAVLEWERWHHLADKLREAGLDFLIGPYIRFKGEPAIGLAIGLVAGYVRWLDGMLMRLMDGLMSIPPILLAIALMALTRASVKNVILAITVAEVPRSDALLARQYDLGGVVSLDAFRKK